MGQEIATSHIETQGERLRPKALSVSWNARLDVLSDHPSKDDRITFADYDTRDKDFDRVQVSLGKAKGPQAVIACGPSNSMDRRHFRRRLLRVHSRAACRASEKPHLCAHPLRSECGNTALAPPRLWRIKRAVPSPPPARVDTPRFRSGRARCRRRENPLSPLTG